MSSKWKVIIVVMLIVNVLSVVMLVGIHMHLQSQGSMISAMGSDLERQKNYFHDMELMTEGYIEERRQNEIATIQLLERQAVALESQVATVAGMQCKPYYGDSTVAVGIICEDIDHGQRNATVAPSN